MQVISVLAGKGRTQLQGLYPARRGESAEELNCPDASPFPEQQWWDLSSTLAWPQLTARLGGEPTSPWLPTL